MRIVSLLPSATEIVCQLGLRDQLVGVTHECDYPPSVLELPKVTRTLIPREASSHEIDQLVRERLKSERALYSLDLPVLQALRPDLIVTQTLCEVCAVAGSEVRAAVCSLPTEPQVINLEPMSLADVFESLRLVGVATGCEARAEQVLARLNQRVTDVVTRNKQVQRPPAVMLLEWIDPPFCAGHWSPELVRLAGGREVIGVEGQASRTIEWSEIVAAQPEVLLIACCGFGIDRTLHDLPILRQHPGWSTLPCVQLQQVYVVDGSAYFNRPGPRLVDSLEILAHAVHPDLHPLPAGIPAARRMTRNELLG